MRRTTFVMLVLAGCGGLQTDPSLQSDNQAESAGSVNAIEPGMQVYWQRGMMTPSAGATPNNLVDHGGPVLAVSQTYAIWWGMEHAFPSDAQAGLNSFFQGLNLSSFLSITTQYMRGATSSTSFHVNLSDTRSPPTRAPSISMIVNEACQVISANGLSPDPSAIYFVYTSNFPRHTNYCAWHSDGGCNGTTIQVAYMPNTTGIAGCDPGNLYHCNGYSQGTRSLVNVTSHEYMEAITDPDISAWYDSSGAEIGDKCAWQFSSCVNLTTGNWQLQQEYSNSANGCVQQ